MALNSKLPDPASPTITEAGETAIGNVELMVVPDGEIMLTPVIRTLVRSTMPVLVTVNVNEASSQLSMNASPSPLKVASRLEPGSISIFGPASGVTVEQLEEGPKHAASLPLGITI